LASSFSLCLLSRLLASSWPLLFRHPPAATGSGTLSLHDALPISNRALGFLSFSRSSAREIPILSDELQLKMQLLVRESLMALMRLNDEIVMTPEMNFSKREKEILKCTAEGNTSAQIAMIL